MTSDEILIEKIAREMCIVCGRDPDAIRPATGYPDARLIPTWYLEIEWAQRALAAHRILSNEGAAA